MVQVDPSAGWGAALRAAGRLVRSLRADERQGRGGSGGSLVVEVLHLPPPTVAQLKVRVAPQSYARTAEHCRALEHLKSTAG